MLQYFISFSEQNSNILSSDIFIIIFSLNSRSSCHNQLVFFVSGCYFKHHRQIILYFLTAASCQNSQYWFTAEFVFSVKLFFCLIICILKRIYRVNRWISNIVNLVIQFVKKNRFKRENTIHLVNISAKAFYSVLLPSPNLR